MGAVNYGDLSSILAETALDEAKAIVALKKAKKGKSKEQCDAMDFFSENIIGSKKGCLGSKNHIISLNEYQKRVANMCNKFNVRARAIEKIGLDESEISEIPPICLSSYVFDDDVSIKIVDGVAVSSQYCVSWIFFSTTQMYTYTFTFDMISDNTWEVTNDFFYQDITCFTTESKIVERIVVVPGKGCLRRKSSALKQNYVVDTLQIIVPNSSYRVSIRDAGSQANSIQAAKAMLRERFIK